jgi:hypothetical protein
LGRDVGRPGAARDGAVAAVVWCTGARRVAWACQVARLGRSASAALGVAPGCGRGRGTQCRVVAGAGAGGAGRLLADAAGVGRL